MGKMLVVYYSSTGHTQLVAERIAKNLDCDIKRIEPVRPLDLGRPLSVVRSVVEQLNPLATARIKDGRMDMSPYDIVFIAEPIWLNTMPKAINAFISENDLSGKAVVAVCTGGSSDGSGNLKALKKALPPDAVIVGAKKFDEDVAEDDVLVWLREL